MLSAYLRLSEISAFPTAGSSVADGARRSRVRVLGGLSGGGDAAKPPPRITWLTKHGTNHLYAERRKMSRHCPSLIPPVAAPSSKEPGASASCSAQRGREGSRSVCSRRRRPG